MVRMKDDHIIRIVNDTLPVPVEVSDDVDVGLLCTSGVIPGLPEEDNVKEAGTFIFQ